MRSWLAWRLCTCSRLSTARLEGGQGGDGIAPGHGHPGQDVVPLVGQPVHAPAPGWWPGRRRPGRPASVGVAELDGHPGPDQVGLGLADDQPPLGEDVAAPPWPPPRRPRQSPAARCRAARCSATAPTSRASPTAPSVAEASSSRARARPASPAWAWASAQTTLALATSVGVPQRSAALDGLLGQLQGLAVAVEAEVALHHDQGPGDGVRLQAGALGDGGRLGQQAQGAGVVAQAGVDEGDVLVLAEDGHRLAVAGEEGPGVLVEPEGGAQVAQQGVRHGPVGLHPGRPPSPRRRRATRRPAGRGRTGRRACSVLPQLEVDHGGVEVEPTGAQPLAVTDEDGPGPLDVQEGLPAPAQAVGGDDPARCGCGPSPPRRPGPGSAPRPRPEGRAIPGSAPGSAGRRPWPSPPGRPAPGGRRARRTGRSPRTPARRRGGRPSTGARPPP